LGDIERQLTAALHKIVDPTVYDKLCAEAARELASFEVRMPREAMARAKRAGTDRLLYNYVKLPRIIFE
jgi:hypothetical protein